MSRAPLRLVVVECRTDFEDGALRNLVQLTVMTGRERGAVYHARLDDLDNLRATVKALQKGEQP
jgi:hypothetical protein